METRSLALDSISSYRNYQSYQILKASYHLFPAGNLSIEMENC